jgi:hypothetical protein
MKRNVSAYLEAIFRFTNAGYVEGMPQIESRIELDAWAGDR